MRHSILFVLLISLSGCVATYRDFPAATPLPGPAEPAAPPRCRQAVQFDRNVDGWSRMTVQDALRDALTTYGGCSSSLLLVYQSAAAETAVMVSVVKKPRVWPGEPEEMLSESLYYLIPIYSGDSGFTLTYSFYARNALRKTYTYEITEKRASWFLLLPFAWINCFTYSLDDAVRATAAQFVTDAHRDGYL
jgi:hypothetical protein